jgi:hypothetical protein
MPNVDLRDRMHKVKPVMIRALLIFSTVLNRPLFAGDPEVRILGYGKEQMWKQIFT